LNDLSLGERETYEADVAPYSVDIVPFENRQHMYQNLCPCNVELSRAGFPCPVSCLNSSFETKTLVCAKSDTC